MSQGQDLPGEASKRRQGERELSRDLGFFAVFATATGTMIGAGIFVLPGVAADGAGPAAVLSFLIAGLITSVAALSVSELATAMPKAGGDYYFVSRASGPLVGTMVGIGAWLALVLKGAFALVGLGQYILHFSPVPVLLTAAAAGVGLTAVNALGAKASGALQNVIVVALLIIMVVFAAVGLTAVDREVISPYFPEGWRGVFATTGVVFISYLGIMKAAAISEEVQDPGRNIPLGILSSVAVVTVLYVLTMVVVTGVLPLDEVVAAAAPVADAGTVFLGAVGGMIVAIAGILATLSTGNAALLSSSRYPFAMARDGLLSQWVSAVHRRLRTPLRSILITGAVMTGLALILDVEGLAKLGGAFGLVVFALVNLSVLILRRTRPPWYRPSFRVPFYPVLPALGVVAALAPLPGMGLLSHAAVVTVGLLAVGWYHWRKRQLAASGEVLQPEFSLGDRLVELRQTISLDEKRVALEARTADDEGRDEEEEGEGEAEARVLVELVENRPNKHLLALAAAFGKRYGAPVAAITVTEVPYQAPLSLGTEGPEKGWVEKLQSRMEEHGVPVRFQHVLTRERARAILRFTRPGLRVVLLDWRREFRRTKLLGSYVDRVVRKSPCRVAVLKYRGHKKYEKILVATAGSPYATAEVELADAVATFTGATLTFMMVLPPDASDPREEQARAYLGKLDRLTDNNAELLLVRSDDVAGAIVDAGEDHDLIVLGASREVSLKTMFGRHVVGRIADEVAERAEGSVLITRDPRVAARLSTRLSLWASWWRSRLSGKKTPARPGPTDVAGPDEVVETFPRESNKERRRK